MEDIQALQGISLRDLRELSCDEKTEVMKQIEEIYQEGFRLEEKAQKLSSDTRGKDNIVFLAKQFASKASTMKMKMNLVDRKSCDSPDEMEHAIQRSITVYAEEQSVIQRLKQNCSLYGLEYRGLTPGNGNCFFEAISCQLRRLALDEIDPVQLRKRVVAYIKENDTYQGNQGLVKLKDFMENGFDEYCDTMSRNGVYADHVVVLGMARMLHRDIVVVTSSPSTESEDCIIWIDGGVDTCGEPFLLGHVYENHYQSLQHIGEALESDSTSLKQQIEDEDFVNHGGDSEDMTIYIEDQAFVDYVKSVYIKKRSHGGAEIYVKRIRNYQKVKIETLLKK